MVRFFYIFLILCSISSNSLFARTKIDLHVRSVEIKLKQLSYKQYKIKSKYNKVQRELKKLKAQLHHLYFVVNKAHKNIPKQRKQIKERLHWLFVLQEMQRLTQLPGFFSFTQPAERKNKQFLTLVIQNQIKHILDLQAKLKQNRKLKELLVQHREKLKDTEEKRKHILALIQAEKMQQKHVLSYIYAKKDLEKRWKQAQAKKERELQRHFKNEKLKNIRFSYSLKGKLKMPVQGEVVQKYQSGVLYKNGVVIQTKKRASVVAIIAGIVRFVGKFQEGYGQLVIIDQGEGSFILYGNLSNITVKQGMQVKAKQIIAKVAETKDKNSLFYFGIRYRNHTVNPMEWVTKKQ